MKRTIRARILLAGAAALSLAVVGSARAVIVFDPSNYAQNLLTAARALQQVQNQITALQNQAQMLLNQARNLKSLPFSALQTINADYARIQSLLGQARGIAYSTQSVDQAFSTLYPTSPQTSATDQALVAAAQARWVNSVQAFQHAMQVQAGVVSNLSSTSTQAGQLVTASQGAVGVLQATQAGNQLLAVQAKQLADLTALLAAQSRAQTLQAAEQSAAHAQAQEQLRRFLGNAHGYQAQPVQMFHQ
jgi:P-type conjugative transfer protein TrbJ